MYGRYYLDSIGTVVAGLMAPDAFKAAAQSVMLVVAVLAGLVLIALARQPWREMGTQTAHRDDAVASPS